MIDPIGNVVVDPVARLRDKSLVIQHPERERIADEIERLRAAVDIALEAFRQIDRKSAEYLALLNIHQHGSE